MAISKNYGLVKSTVLESILNFQHPSERYFWRIVEIEQIQSRDWEGQIHQYMVEDYIKKVTSRYSIDKPPNYLHECYFEIAKVHGYDSVWWGAGGVALKLLFSDDQKVANIQNSVIRNLLSSSPVKILRMKMKKPNFWNGVILPYWRLNANPTLIYDDIYKWVKGSAKVTALSIFLGDQENKNKLLSNQTPTAMLCKSVLEDLCKVLYPLALKIARKDFLTQFTNAGEGVKSYAGPVLADCLERCPSWVSYFETKEKFKNDVTLFLNSLEDLAHGEIRFEDGVFETFLNFFFDLRDFILDAVDSVLKDYKNAEADERETDLNWEELRMYPFNSYDEEEVCEHVRVVRELIDKGVPNKKIRLRANWGKFLDFSNGLTPEQRVLIEPYLARGLLEVMSDGYIKWLGIKKDMKGNGLTKRVTGVLEHIISSRKNVELNKIATSLWKKSETVVSEISDHAHNPFTISEHANDSMIAFAYRFMLVVLA